MQTLTRNYFLPVTAAFLLITLWVAQHMAGSMATWVAFQELRYPEMAVVTQTLASDHYFWVWLPEVLDSFPYEIAYLLVSFVGLTALAIRIGRDLARDLAR